MHVLSAIHAMHLRWDILIGVKIFGGFLRSIEKQIYGSFFYSVNLRDQMKIQQAAWKYA